MRLQLFQQACDQLGGEQLSGAGEEGLGRKLKKLLIAIVKEPLENRFEAQSHSRSDWDFAFHLPRGAVFRGSLAILLFAAHSIPRLGCFLPQPLGE